MVPESLAQAIRDTLVDGRLACAEAFRIAREHKVAPAEVGQAADELDLRICRCQLGLFGYGPKEEGKHRIVKPLTQVPPELSREVNARLTEGQLPCAAAWAVARQLGIPMLEVSGAAETLEIHISSCQLGCF